MLLSIGLQSPIHGVWIKTKGLRWGPDYVDQLVRVARGPVGIDSEKIAILKSALTCAHKRVLTQGGIMAWPEAIEARILKELQHLVGKRRFHRWATENLPFISAQVRRTRIKLATQS